MFRSLVVLICCLMLAPLAGADSPVAAAEARGGPLAHLDPDRPFSPLDDPMEALDTATMRAADAGKELLVILGANWCHDSRGLMDRLSTNRMGQVLEARYETVIIDVGFFEAGEPEVSRFGLPTLYATPTVLIVDPVSGRLKNRQSMFLWANAASISLEDTHAYFTKLPDRAPPSFEPGSENARHFQRLIASIDAFELKTATHISQAYQVLGPIMATMQGDEADPRLDAYWNDLRQVRYRLMQDLPRLRAQAFERVKEGKGGQAFDLPHYPRLDWPELDSERSSQ